MGMGMGMRVTSNIKEFIRDLKAIPDKVVKVATRQALNRAATGTTGEIRRELAQELKTPQKNVKPAMSLKKASARDLSAELTVKGGKRSLIPLDKTRDARVTSFRKGKRRTTRVRFRGKVIRGAFAATVGNRKRAIFSQVAGAPRSPRTGNIRIQRLYTFTPAQEFESKNLDDKATRIGNKRFDKAFSDALTNQLRRHGWT